MNMTRKATKDIDYEVSTGNVYADLGFADAAEMLAKARIVAQIGRIIQARKLTQVQAAELLGIDQPKVSALLRGHFKGYSQERLIGFLTKLGMDVEIVVRPRARKRQNEGTVSVVFA
jgi:predicted XRE-type DNA-binding protein